ncbi:hypothetical protein [Mesorhizobium sp. M0965]|uniref:hypothetical protein n=1 Tax=unclassified Mesorhizobium TaxID=325217 RepID=UPI00333A1196
MTDDRQRYEVEFDELMDDVDPLVPVVLKGHLLIEHFLDDLISSGCVNPDHIWNGDAACGVMKLRYVPRFRDARSREELLALPHSLEPPIPFHKIPVEAYQAAEPFDYVILCQSPGYTPVEADALIPIFKDYIEFDSDDSQGFPGLGLHPNCTGEAR